jgi:hypothetical protein
VTSEPEHPRIEAVIVTVLSAIRTMADEMADENPLPPGQPVGRRQVSTMLGKLGEEHGANAVVSAGVLLAEAAANGFGMAARKIGHPVERILADYERHVREDIDFLLLVARQFPPEDQR